MHFTYVLLSNKDHKFYIGYTSDLDKRINAHQEGEVQSTKSRRPFQLVYYEACNNQKDAIHREKYFKSGFGRRFLNNRLENFFKQS
jgi:putative endonuclease